VPRRSAWTLGVSKMKCWEFLDCPEEVRRSCPAFLKENCEECWLVTDKICKGGTATKGSIEEKLIECTRCNFYKNILKKQIDDNNIS
jgi:hypothetical protein